jgi:CubicO group peptidase (beta-lactamase class C family)
MRKLSGLVVHALLLLPIAAFAAPPIPPTPAGTVLAEWLNGFNSADRTRISAFQETYKRETPVDDVLQQRRETGGYELEAVESVSPTRVVAVLHEAMLPDSRIRLDLTVEPAPANAIAKLEVEYLPVARLSESDFPGALDVYVQRLVKEDLFSGAVLVSRGERILARDAWGMADRERNIANKEGSQFRLGSMNKAITAVAALQLVENGKLALDTPIGDYLPNYPNADAAAKVTLRHLLTHRAGVGEIAFNDSAEFGTPAEFISRRESMRTPADYLRQYGSQALEFEPGTRTEYSSLGFMIVGALIEQASGKSYYDYVQANLLDPTGMSSTGSLPESDSVPNRVVGYTRQGDVLVPNGDTLPYRGSPAGGGYSTVDDLLRFAQALRAGKLLSPEMTAEATRLHSGWQGLGFEVMGEGDMLSFGHGGMAPGMNAHFRVYPALDYTVVVLSNLDPPAAGLVYAFIADRMPTTADVVEAADQ